MKRRIIISLWLLFAVCLLGDAAAMFCLSDSVRRFSALAESHRIQWLRANLSSDGVRVQTDLLSDLLGHKHTDDERAENLNRFSKSLQRCRRCHHPPHLTAEFEGVRDSFEQFRAASADYFARADASDAEGLSRAALHLGDRFVEQTTAMADRADRHLTESSTDAVSRVRHAWAVLSGTLAALLAGGGFVALHLRSRLTKPMDALLRGVERARTGDLGDDLPPRADPEFRTLADAFKSAYADLKTAQQNIFQAEKLAATGKLAAGIAHEVLNPLASISSIAQVMRRHCESGEQREHADLILAETKRISSVVRELLSFSRPTKAETFTRLEVGPMLDRAVTLIEYDHRARDVNIVRRFDSDLPAVSGDAQRLPLVFTNIMFNALDAMSDHANGVGELTISAQRTTDGVEVCFQDRGPGMTDEQLAHAFDPFFTTKEPGAGTGLGLWICYEVIQRHNGVICIESRVGEGATVRIELPGEPEG